MILSVDADRKLKKGFYLYSVISKNNRIVRWRRPCIICTDTFATTEGFLFFGVLSDNNTKLNICGSVHHA